MLSVWIHDGAGPNSAHAHLHTCADACDYACCYTSDTAQLQSDLLICYARTYKHVFMLTSLVV